VRRLLNVWPAFPLHIYFDSMLLKPEDNLDNLIAALEHPDRVCEVDFTSPPESLWDQVLALMQEPFPALTRLSFRASIDCVLHLPGTFLDGSAPNLKHLHLWGVSSPSFPRLLLSATNLTTLHLEFISNIGYIPPEAMATCLSTLTRLETLAIRFQSHPKQKSRCMPPPTRSILPALTSFDFQGVSEYLEAFAGQIDAPLLKVFWISLFNQLVTDIPQTIRFLSHIESVRQSRPSLEFFPTGFVSISFYPNWYQRGPVSRWTVICQGFIRQVISAAQICSGLRPLSSGVEGLDIKRYYLSSKDVPPADIDHTLWLDLFQSFPYVRRLRMSAEMEPFIAAALQKQTGESTLDVFPSLESLSIDSLTADKATKEGIEAFITARQHSGHPVTVHRTQSGRWIE
jgi:hypothetical protein